MNEIKLKNIAKEIANRKWFHVIERPSSPVLGWDSNISSINYRLAEILNTDMTVGGFVFFENNLMVDMEDHIKVNAIILNKYKNNKKYLKRMCKIMEKDCDLLRKQTKNIKSDDLDFLNKFFELHRNAIHHFRWIFNATEVFEKITGVYEEIPIKDNYITKYHREINKIIHIIKKEKELSNQIRKGNFKEIEKYPKVVKKIKKFLQEFDWMKILHHQGESIIFEDVLEEIRNNFDISVSKIKKVNKKDTDDVKLLKYFIFLRTHLSESNAYADAKIKPVLEKLGKKFNLKYEDIAFLTEKEIKELLEKNKLIVSLEQIKDRQKNGYACINLDGEYNFIEGDNLQKLYSYYGKHKEKENLDSIKELKGAVGNKGLIKGVVKVIQNVNEFNKFKKGDILVANSTTPNYISIMGKASAFLTDEGGITCHAVIVGRELNKPCIIGLKNATKVLKDGDLVEVDANKGIVKKI